MREGVLSYVSIDIGELIFEPLKFYFFFMGTLDRTHVRLIMEVVQTRVKKRRAFALRFFSWANLRRRRGSP